jgi:hypothetical protein
MCGDGLEACNKDEVILMTDENEKPRRVNLDDVWHTILPAFSVEGFARTGRRRPEQDLEQLDLPLLPDNRRLTLDDLGLLRDVERMARRLRKELIAVQAERQRYERWRAWRRKQEG